MSTETDPVTSSSSLSGLRRIIWSANGRRVRATWRVLLALPVLWLLTGGILAGNVQSAVEVIPAGNAPGGGLAQSLLHAGFFVLALVPWARYLDRQPLSTYGVSVTPTWGLHVLVGFVALMLGFGFWIGVGSVRGATTVTLSPSLPRGSILFGLVLPFIALVLHAAVQQVVFFRVILKSAAEGLHSREVSVVHAALGAIPVAVLFFLLIHELSVLRALDIVVAGSVFALLYLHTGELALGIGAHFGGLYAGIVVSTLVQTSGSLPGIFGVINQYGFPKVVVAYVVMVAWLKWWQGEVSIRNEIAQQSG